MIVVNQTLARRFWPGRSALGGRVAIDQIAGHAPEIVGVVGDVKPERSGWRGMAHHLHSVLRKDPRLR